jgi:aspartyl protease family protein
VLQFLLPLMAVTAADAVPLAAPGKAQVAAVSARKAAPAIWLVPPGGGQRSVVSGQARGPIELWRASDGLFYVDGAVNGRTVRFLVDTGASMIVLTADDAERAGVTGSHGAIRAETASGDSAMRAVTLGKVQVGATLAAAVPAAVAPRGLKVSLLGQNWLSYIGSLRIEGDRMLIE